MIDTGVGMRFDCRLVFLFVGPVLLILGLSGCAANVAGPDKQFVGSAQGAIVGAGAGAVTGAQVSAATGPGAAIGAGLGAVVGGVKGYLVDLDEERIMKAAAEIRRERQRAIVHEILHDHYNRRLELHPTRDIYPADLFFFGDQAKLRPCARMLLREISVMNKERMPSSRLAVVAYNMSSDSEVVYGKELAERRARAIVNAMVEYGIEPRRMEARAVLMEEPLLIDPNDHPDRYRQAIELLPLDR